MNWQPIETAPQIQGKQILLGWGGKPKRIALGFWDAQPYHTKPRPRWSTVGLIGASADLLNPQRTGNPCQSPQYNPMESLTFIGYTYEDADGVSQAKFFPTRLAAALRAFELIPDAERVTTLEAHRPLPNIHELVDGCDMLFMIDENRLGHTDYDIPGINTSVSELVSAAQEYDLQRRVRDTLKTWVEEHGIKPVHYVAQNHMEHARNEVV